MVLAREASGIVCAKFGRRTRLGLVVEGYAGKTLPSQTIPPAIVTQARVVRDYFWGFCLQRSWKNNANGSAVDGNT